MPLDWHAVVEKMTNVQRMVHLAMRYDVYDEERIRSDLLKERRVTYEDELTIQAARMGCPGRSGRLSNGAILSQLYGMSKEDSESIANTYNYDLAIAILHIFSEVPTANRYVYAKRLSEWEEKRGVWKHNQIALYTEGSARALAQEHFYQYNAGILGVAILEPRTGVCPVCVALIARGEVPLREAMRTPPPFHPNCPHYWRTVPQRVPPSECPLLWMGE